MPQPKFALATNALLHVSVKQKYFQSILEGGQQYVCWPPQIACQAPPDNEIMDWYRSWPELNPVHADRVDHVISHFNQQY